MPHGLSVQRARFGPLDALEVPGAGPVVVCFHGYGADASDLTPLAAEFNIAARWIFPEAPISLGGGMPSSRAWFPIPDEAFMQVNMGRPLEMDQGQPEGLAEGAAAARAAVEALKVPARNLILGGFSRGAMMALELALSWPEPVAGLFLLSGTLVDAGSVARRAGKVQAAPFFQSHGRQDPVLSFPAAQRLFKTLTGAGWNGRFVDFDGGHGIGAEAMDGLKEYLGSLA